MNFKKNACKKPYSMNLPKHKEVFQTLRQQKKALVTILPPNQQKGLFIRHDITAEKWAKNHDLEIKKGFCEVCEAEVVTDIPCFMKGYVGLVCNPCEECETPVTLSVFSPNSEETIKAWNDVE